MSKKLFVGGLSFDTNDTGLKDSFAQFGEVTEARVVTDRDSGRSRGFGFVTLASDEAAEKAIAGMNGKQVGGRSLTVNIAKNRSDDSGSRDGGGGGGGYNRGGGNRW